MIQRLGKYKEEGRRKKAQGRRQKIEGLLLAESRKQNFIKILPTAN
jgi:hypothetical protein